MDKIRTQDLFDLSHTRAAQLLVKCEYPWEALAQIGETLLLLGKMLDPLRFEQVKENVWIAKSASVDPLTRILAPCIIGENTQVRPGAFLRGDVLIGEDAVVGNSTELKNCILFDRVQVPHYNYVGDSILGYKAHMGAGAVTSNVKGDRTLIVVKGKKRYDTGRKKLGAMLGDEAEIGCGAVLNPGTIIGRGTQVYPLVSVRGVIAEGVICKGERGVFAREEHVKE